MLARGKEASGNDLAAGNEADLLRGMDLIENAWMNLQAYPRWLVATCGVIVGVTLLWVVGKILKWTLYLVVGLAMLILVAGAVYWFLGLS